MGTHPVHAGYVGVPTFFQAPLAGLEAVREGTTVIAGVPIDQGIVLAKPGARFGPRAIREASAFPRAIFAANAEHTAVDVDTGVALRLRDSPHLVDVGDFDVDPTDVMRTTEAVIRGVADIVRRGGLPVLLGGDHYVAYPGFAGFAEGMSERTPGVRLGYLHIDSHPDFRDEYGPVGGKYNHSTAARRISEHRAISYRHMAWIGLNGPVLDAAMARMRRAHRLKMLTARAVRERGAKEVVREAMEAVAADVDAVYVSIDIDVVNNAEARGTGAPVFAGIQAREFLELMEALSAYEIVRAIDLCEVSPPLDPAGTTADLAAFGLLAILERRLFERVSLEA